MAAEIAGAFFAARMQALIEVMRLLGHLFPVSSPLMNGEFHGFRSVLANLKSLGQHLTDYSTIVAATLTAYSFVACGRVYWCEYEEEPFYPQQIETETGRKNKNSF